ncbi:MAG: hypothetical protein Q7S37_03615 [bacterium]|nr:hypothetical protein [bacterium]
MALEATHMRFALDVKYHYTINDIAKYIQGTIYPDSRYVSGINRNLTHSDIVLKPEFTTNDFNSGWQVHQSCDKIQGKVFHKNIPGLNKFPTDGYQENWWIAITATKIIADMKDMQSFDIQSILKYLNSKFCPNGEDVSAIQRNNQITIGLYKDKIVPSVDDYIVMWNELGVSKELGDKVRKMTEQLINDGLSDIIWSCYNKMLNSFDKARLESL